VKIRTNPRLALIFLAFISAGGAQAQSRSLRVRLFWLHPPATITITSLSPTASLRLGSANPKTGRPGSAIVMAAEGNRLRTGGHLWSQAEWLGKARLEGEGFASFQIAFPLTITARQGRLHMIARMSLEEYVAAVLAGEAGGFQSDEALKAMAVAARTYAVRFQPRHAAEGFDFCDTTHCQDLRLSD